MNMAIMSIVIDDLEAIQKNLQRKWEELKIWKKKKKIFYCLDHSTAEIGRNA